MSDELVIVPSDGDGYVELAKTKSGRIFRKHILNLGDLRHPKTGKIIKVDDAFATKLKENFDAGYCPIVQIPLANEKNEHTEAPDKNIGEVVDIEVKDKKVYAILDVRKDEYANELGKTLLGASAMLSLDYEDTKTGNKVGPTLIHSCVTNRPFVTDLEPYEEIAATSDSSDGAVVLLSGNATVVEEPETEETDVGAEDKTTETPKPTVDELFAALKEHGIDVPALQAQATEGATAAKLSQTLVKELAEAGFVKLTDDEDAETVSTEDVVGAVGELAKANVELTNRVNKLEQQDAEHIVDALIGEGRIRPAERAARVELKLTNPAMFDKLLPAEAIVKLDAENGKTPAEDAAHNKNIDEDIARLSALANGLFQAKSK